MNKSGNGRWGRYQTINGEPHKKCNGPLHGLDGAFLPFRSFWTMRSGPRAGKLMARCIACEKAYRGFDPELSGLVETQRVLFVFEEIKRRIGKAEACRRLGVSQNMWMRMERKIYTKMYRRTAKAAMLLLRELRDNDVVYHRDSIKHGAKARGRKVKRPETLRDYYVPTSDADIQARMEREKKYRKDPEYVRTANEKRNARLTRMRAQVK